MPSFGTMFTVLLFALSALVVAYLIRRWMDMRSSEKEITLIAPISVKDGVPEINWSITDWIKKVVEVLGEANTRTVHRALRAAGYREPCSVRSVGTVLNTLTRNRELARQRVNCPSARLRRNNVRFTLRRP